jgi:rhomboid protease GluP
MHILFNCWALMDVGARAEEVYGTKRMTAIYMISSVGGFVASMMWRPTVSVGASAGLFGLIGAMIAVGWLHHSAEAQMLKGFYLRWAVYGLLWGLLPFFRVDNAAHIGGLATGFVTAWLADLPAPMKPWKERLWGGIAGAMVALTVLAFVRMFLWMTAVSAPAARVWQ